MFLNYLRIARRNLTRHIGYTLINLGGLGACMACCLIIIVFIKNELSFDKHHQDADRIYRITVSMNMGNAEVPVIAPGLLGPALVESWSGVEAQVRIRCMDEPVIIKSGDNRFQEPGQCFSESSIFNIFDLSLSEGTAQDALEHPNSIVLSRKLAEKYFGDDDPIGQQIELDGEHSYEIVGVLDAQEKQSHLSFGLLASFSSLTANDPLIESWADGGANPYVVLSPGYSREDLETHLDSQLETYMGYFAEGMTAHVEPITEIYFSAWPASSGELRGNIDYVYLFSVVAFLLLSIACINYMNMATARALQRAREVGVRKAMGASKKQLIHQFMSESFVLCGFALVTAFILAWLMLPSFGGVVGRELTGINLLSPLTLLAAAFLGIVIALLAGSYPAFHLSSFDPVVVLKRKTGSSKSSAIIRKSLLIVQFSLSMGLAASTVVLWNQLSYMRGQNLGFDKENIVLVTPTDEIKGQYETFKSELLALPDVVGVTTAPLPGHDFVLISTHRVEDNDHETDGLSKVETFDVDYDFVDLMDIDVLAGRNFAPTLRGDENGSILINEAAVRFFGWGSPEKALGKWVKRRVKRDGRWEEHTFHVVGVLEDFQSWTMRTALSPIFIYLAKDEVKWWGNVIVKINPSDIPFTLSNLEEVWAEFAPDRVFEYSFLEQEIDLFYREDIRQGKLLGMFSFLSVIIASLGLFGLAAFMIAQRTKEIGIRKVLGANVRDVLGMLCKEYVVLVASAFVISSPLTYMIMQRWLSQFAYSVGIGWGTLVLVGIGALALCLITVSYQSARAALADPVHTLKHE